MGESLDESDGEQDEGAAGNGREPDAPPRRAPAPAEERDARRPVAHPRPAPAPADERENLARLTAILERYEIQIADADDLLCLDDYEMVILADDSGSMASSAVPKEARQLGAKKKTRWDELRSTVGLIVELGACFDQNGVDVHFLNRPSALACMSSDEPALRQSFDEGPRGSTPLTSRLHEVVKGLGREKPVLMFILTDGEPDNGVDKFVEEVTRTINDRRGKVKFQIMACTDNDEDVGWLNDMDKMFPEVDTTDDYQTERQEVLKAGRWKEFTAGDWCMKAMLGPISPKFDTADEAAPRSRACVLL